MKDSKKVKKVLVKNYNAITKAIQAIDIIEGKLSVISGAKFTAQLTLAAAVLHHKKKAKTPVAKIDAEVKRLIALARGIVAKDGYAPKHAETKNAWSSIRRILIRDLLGDSVITAKAGKDDKGNIVTDKVKASSIQLTAKSMATHGADLTAAIGKSDKRKDNAPKKTRKARTPDSTPKEHSTQVTAKSWNDSFLFAWKMVKTSRLLVRAIIDNDKKIIDVAAAMGYVITITKK